MKSTDIRLGVAIAIWGVSFNTTDNESKLEIASARYQDGVSRTTEAAGYNDAGFWSEGNRN